MRLPGARTARISGASFNANLFLIPLDDEEKMVPLPSSICRFIA